LTRLPLLGLPAMPGVITRLVITKDPEPLPKGVTGCTSR